MTKKIRKAVIPVAGLGTRFLPVTKSTPKELLPIVDKPTIQLIVEEAVSSGIESIIFVIAKGKEAIADHFDLYPELHKKLISDGKHELAERLEVVSENTDIVCIRQGEPRGLGHAVLCAKNLVGDEPFIVALGDDIVDAEKPLCQQLIDVYDQQQKSVVAIMEVPEADVEKFGIAEGSFLDDQNMQIESMVEKPSPEETDSRYAIVGRYLFTPKIFSFLEETDPGKGGEIQLTDAMDKLKQEEGFIGNVFSGERHDAGDTFGFVKANIAYALKRPEIAPKLKEYMKSIAE